MLPVIDVNFSKENALPYDLWGTSFTRDWRPRSSLRRLLGPRFSRPCKKTVGVETKVLIGKFNYRVFSHGLGQ